MPAPRRLHRPHARARNGESSSWEWGVMKRTPRRIAVVVTSVVLGVAGPGAVAPALTVPPTAPADRHRADQPSPVPGGPGPGLGPAAGPTRVDSTRFSRHGAYGCVMGAVTRATCTLTAAQRTKACGHSEERRRRSSPRSVRRVRRAVRRDGARAADRASRRAASGRGPGPARDVGAPWRGRTSPTSGRRAEPDPGRAAGLRLPADRP
jgi:hypothetical protein